MKEINKLPRGTRRARGSSVIDTILVRVDWQYAVKPDVRCPDVGIWICDLPAGRAYIEFQLDAGIKIAVAIPSIAVIHL